MRHIASALVILLATSPAYALVLCARPRADGSISTSLKVREVCKLTEMQLDPIGLGLQGPPGPQGEPGSPGPAGTPPMVVDANAVEVGLWDLEGGVVRSFGSRRSKFVLTGQGAITFAEQYPLLYESTNCTGPALLYYPSAIMPLGAIRGTRLFYSDVPVGMRLLQSAWHSGACEPFSPANNASVATTVEEDVSTLVFPLSLQF